MSVIDYQCKPVVKLVSCVCMLKEAQIVRPCVRTVSRRSFGSSSNEGTFLRPDAWLTEICLNFSTTGLFLMFKTKSKIIFGVRSWARKFGVGLYAALPVYVLLGERAMWKADRCERTFTFIFHMKFPLKITRCFF